MRHKALRTVPGPGYTRGHSASLPLLLLLSYHCDVDAAWSIAHVTSPVASCIFQHWNE